MARMSAGHAVAESLAQLGVKNVMGMVGSFFIAIFLSGWAAAILQKHLEIPYSPALVVGFLIIFVGGMVAFVMAVVAAGTLIVLVNVDDLQGAFAKYLLFQSLALALVAVVASNLLLERHTDYPNHPSWFVRWAGIVGTLGVSGSLAILVINMTAKAGLSDVARETPEGLSGVAYVILSVVLLLIFLGLGWCFYRAMTVGASDAPVQRELDAANNA